ncbi:hypothetical protein DL546_000856 [Coniochaeta pulveracea]|uniref:C2H2-type domain-containing protein n=1 Tax=Coniochaeta pulveracea TaxID=177199 RepID=A0A420Y5I6_9PEZI|nr:hypothetical protein DL546_000856 [Coniochaeta pulveracea]
MASWDYECGTCYKVFASGWRAREQHCDATGHSRPDNECDTCARYFRSEDACWNHISALGHFVEVCSMCDTTWPDETQLERHEHDDLLYCNACDRFFHNNLRMHLTSRVHLGTNMACPFCTRGFTTATGVAHHIEAGACPNAPNINRDALYELIRAKDPYGLITKKLIGWMGSATFRTLHGLNQHTNSPIHQQKLYHCPNRRSCSQDFVCLGAIINHLESEACGFTRFHKVQSQFGAIIDPGRRLTFWA